MDSIDTDINNYSINELKEILNLNNILIDKNILKSAYEKKIDINNEIDNIELRNKLNSFFREVYLFLENHIEDKIEKIQEKNLEKDIENLENKFNYLVDFNFKSNPSILGDVLSTDPINQSNINLNPRTYNLIKKQISINSEFRKKSVPKPYVRPGTQKSYYPINDLSLALLDETSTDFTIELPEPIDNVISVELVHIEIPNLINTFSERKGNNKFRIDLRLVDLVIEAGAIMSIDIRIPTGIWTSGNLIEYFSENYFDVDIIENGILINRYLRYLKFDIEEFSAKTVFRLKTDVEMDNFNKEQEQLALSTNTTYDASKNLVPNIRDRLGYRLSNIWQEYQCKNSERKFNKYRGGNEEKINFGFTTLGTLGFELEQIYYEGEIDEPIWIDYSNINFDASFSLLLEYNGFLRSLRVYGAFQETALYVSVNDFVGNHGQQILLLGYNNSLISDDILARVPVKIEPFQHLLFNSVTDYNIKREYYGGVRIRKLHIQVIDKYGRIVDLSDYPTNFVFEFTIQYSSERLAIFRNRM